MNALASVIRGTGNMLVPVAVGLRRRRPCWFRSRRCLIFGLGPLPALGIAGGGVAVVATTALMAAILAWYILSGSSVVRFRIARLTAALLRRHLAGRRGRLAQHAADHVDDRADHGLVGERRPAPDAVAGYGTGSRLEYLLVPLVFGLGAPLVAMVGTNIGAGQNAPGAARRADRRGIAFVACRGDRASARRSGRAAWLGLFGDDPVMLATGANYLRFVGPFYGFFGLGLALYFASQGAGRLLWPLLAGCARLVIAVGGGWLALAATGSESSVFVMLAVALAAYGAIIGIAVRSGVWFRSKPRAGSCS